MIAKTDFFPVPVLEVTDLTVFIKTSLFLLNATLNNPLKVQLLTETPQATILLMKGSVMCFTWIKVLLLIH